MDNAKNRVKQIRLSRGFSIDDVAQGIDVSGSHYRKLENGDRRLNIEHLFKLADFFNVSIDYLTGKDDREEIFPNIISIEGNSIAMLPVIGDIAAGTPMMAIPENDEYMLFDTKLCNINGHALDEYFYLRIKGDSMEPTISDGDIALVRRQTVVENGEVAVVLCNRENATCKRVTLTESSNIILSSDNKNYAPMVYNVDDCLIIGKVIGHYGGIR